MQSPAVDLEVSVDAGPDADDEEVARLAASLRRELLELEVENVELAATDAVPDGARGVEALALGALVVRLVRTPEALGAVARAVRAWLSGHGGRRVRIELEGDVLEVTGVSAADQERLVTAWIERQARG
ncbi:MAG: hypothetical protein ACRDN6_03180 [Gaiellaceae bacterium]